MALLEEVRQIRDSLLWAARQKQKTKSVIKILITQRDLVDRMWMINYIVG